MEDVTKLGKNFLINKSGNEFADGAQYWLKKYEENEIGGAKEELFFILRNSEYDQIVLTHIETSENISTKVRERFLSDDPEMLPLQLWIKRGISRHCRNRAYKMSISE